jgi:hypothetical protein
VAEVTWEVLRGKSLVRLTLYFFLVRKNIEKIKKRTTIKILGGGGSVNTTPKSTYVRKEDRTKKNCYRESKYNNIAIRIIKEHVCLYLSGLNKYEKSGVIKVFKIGNSLIWAKTGIKLKGLAGDVTRCCPRGRMEGGKKKF